MKTGKLTLWLLASLMLVLAGCGGSGGNAVSQNKDGYSLNITGKVVVPKTAAKTVGLVTIDPNLPLNKIAAYDATTGLMLGTPVDCSTGKFSGLSYSLTNTQTTVVYVANVTGGPLRYILPIDLTNPPTGLSNSPVSITINQDSTNTVRAVEAELGILSGYLGDGTTKFPATFNSATFTFTKAAEMVLKYGGLALAYTTNGIALSGTVSNTALLPTKDASTFTNDDLNNVVPECKIISAFIPGKNPIVNFQVTNKATGKGISGLRTFGLHVAKLMPEASGSNSYWVNYIDKGITLPAPLTFAYTGSGSTAKAVTGAITKPSADPAKTIVTSSQNGLNLTTYPVGSVLLDGYTVVDHGDGNYTAVFGSDITSNPNALYEADKVHRIGVTVTSIAVPGVTATGPINPVTGAVNTSFLANNRAAVVYDFVPATGLAQAVSARDIVTTAACNQCHYNLAAFNGHFARWNTKLCVMCHTSSNTSGEGEFVTLIHRIHRGEDLPVAISAESVVNPSKPLARTSALVTYSEVKFPQDARNCTTCHKGLESTNWKMKPSRKACGACHNNINFTTGVSTISVPVIGTQHTAQANDQTCAGCHSGITAAYEVAAFHIPVAEATSSTSGVKSYYADNSNLPTGAYKIEYAISSVALDANRKVSVKFQIKKDDSAVNFGTYDATTNPNLIANTVGGPSMRIAFNVPQDGIATPSDTNTYISIPGLGVPAPTVPTTAAPPGTYTAPVTTSSLWAKGSITDSSGITWTLTGPESGNIYTIASDMALPASTTMVTAFMYGGMTQTNLNLDGNGKASFKADSISDFTSYVVASGKDAGKTAYAITKNGLTLCPPNVSKSVTTTGYTARRTIVDNAKCQSCHARLGHKPNFHSGGRNDGTNCNICHTPNGNNGGWSYGFNTFIHAIHGKSKRTVNYTFGATSTTEGLFEVAYPGILRNCEQCHVSGAYDFTLAANASAASNLLFNTVATGTTSAASYNTSPYIAQTAGTLYGNAFSYTITSGVGVATQAGSGTLVSSPISAACFACHDTTTARSHMENNGGVIYKSRNIAFVNTSSASGRSYSGPAKLEQCLVCHGPANNAINASVPTIKAVHRWW